MDYDTVLKLGTKQEREKFLEASLQSIQQIRRLRHPSILRIIEASESVKALDFAAEPVMSCLAYEDSFSPDDAAYLAFQLATVMHFLHQNAKLVMFGLSTFSLCLTNVLALKVCLFTYSSPLTSEYGAAVPKFTEFNENPFQPPLNFCSTEYIATRQVTWYCDIFSYGCVFASMIQNRQAFDCATIDEYHRAVAAPINFSATFSNEVRDLIRSCLAAVPGQRPLFDRILRSPVFKTMPLQALQYCDLILTKTDEDKYNFFNGISNTLSNFSLRLLQCKMIPLFVSEVLREPRFGSVLIPLIFEIARSLDKPAFRTSVFNPLQPLLASIAHPPCFLAILTCLPIIIDRLDDGLHYELIYPVISTALSSPLGQLHHEALQHMPSLVDKIPSDTVDQSVVPALIELFSTSSDVKVVSACVQSLADCLPKIAHDSFSERVVPRIAAAWNRLGEPGALADACLYVVERLNASVDVEVRQVVPMVSEILGSDTSPPPTQLALCTYIKERTAQMFTPRKGMWVRQVAPRKKAAEVRERVEIAPYQPPRPAAVAPEEEAPVPSMFAGMNTKVAKPPAASMFSGLKMGGGKGSKG
jgi:serine/threonine protein kinase